MILSSCSREGGPTHPWGAGWAGGAGGRGVQAVGSKEFDHCLLWGKSWKGGRGGQEVSAGNTGLRSPLGYQQKGFLCGQKVDDDPSTPGTCSEGLPGGREVLPCLRRSLLAAPSPSSSAASPLSPPGPQWGN